jgi:hypothetical protein
MNDQFTVASHVGSSQWEIGNVNARLRSRMAQASSRVFEMYLSRYAVVSVHSVRTRPMDQKGTQANLGRWRSNKVMRRMERYK